MLKTHAGQKVGSCEEQNSDQKKENTQGMTSQFYQGQTFQEG